MKKQIEEIKDCIDSVYGCDCAYFGVDGLAIAEAIYNAGYRKHIVAEWKAGNENGQNGYYCSNCKAGFTGENAEWIAKEHDFCPNCGAKMKGVKDGKQG